MDEQVIAELVGDDPVDLLGHRAVEAPQAGLDVRDRDAELDRDERRGERGVDVARNDHEFGTLALHHRLDSLHHTRGLHGVARRPHAEHVVGRRDAELLEEDVDIIRS